MRNIFLSFIVSLLLLPSLLTAQPLNGTIGTPSRPATSLISDNGKQIVVNFHLDGFTATSVNTPRGTQSIITVPGMAPMLQAGAPDLPHYAIPAIIGDKTEMQVNIAKAKYIDYENVEIAPSKGNFSRQINPDDVPYTYGEAYSANAFFPTTQAYLEKPYIIRNFRGQNIMVTPFAYNPVTKTLRVYTDLTIEMDKVSDNGENPKTRARVSSKISSENKAEYSRRFINYNTTASKYTFIEDRGEMLVICPEQYMEAMQPFVDWKNISGRPTTMVSLTEVGGNNDTEIKSYIQNIYNDANRNLRFILLVGDYEDLTPHQNGLAGYSDIWFGQLEGDDYYPEALVGRFSANNIADINTQVNKVIYYESEMPEGLSWLNKGIGIASNEGGGNGHNGGESDFIHMNFIRDTLLHYTYEEVSQHYAGVGSGTSAEAISANINEGASILNYCNHGTTTSWSVAHYNNSNIRSLTNYNKWPYIISTACYNGQFNTDCFAEVWLKSANSNNGKPIGAVGGIFSWISQPWTPPMTGQDEINNIITEWRSSDKFNHTMGGAFLNGSSYILDMHPSDNGDTFNTWILFGDPSLMLRTDNPTSMNVTTDKPALFVGDTRLFVNAQTEYGLATLSIDNQIIGCSFLNNGFATINFNPLTDIATAKLVVIGYNKVTYQADINILSTTGPYLAVDSYTPHQTLSGQETPLSLTIKNFGIEANQANTIVSLTSDNENFTFIKDSDTIGALESNESITLDNFRFKALTEIEDGTSIPVTVTIANGNDTWTSIIEIKVYKVLLDYQHCTWVGGFTPGQTIGIAATFKNNGHYSSNDAVATISSTSEYVTIANPSVNYGLIIPNGTATVNFAIAISSQCPATEPIPLHFSITDKYGNTAEGDTILANACDIVVTMFDSFGDGWNGASLTFDLGDGTPDTTLYMNNGSSLEHILSVKTGNTISIVFNGGTPNSTGQVFDKECFFSIDYADGREIFSCVKGDLTGKDGQTITTFEANCTAIDNIVVLLTATAIGNSASLSWETQTRFAPNKYTIYRTDLLKPLAEVTPENTTYTDQNLPEGTYYYIVEANYDAMSFMSNPTKVTINNMGINSHSDKVKIYPNPAHDKLFIEGEDISNILIYNAYGQVVSSMEAHSNNMEINTGSLASGLYIVRIISGQESSLHHVIIR